MKWTFMSLQIMHEINMGKMSFSQMLSKAKEAGFVAYDASAWDSQYATPNEVKKICKDNGLEIADYIHWIHISSCTEDGMNKAIEEGKHGVELALEYETNKLMIVEQINDDLKQLSREDASDCMVKVLSAVTDYAGNHGVTVMFEDFPDTGIPMCTWQECAVFLNQIPNLKLVYDTGNMLAQKQQPDVFYQKLKDYVVHVHLKDIEYPENVNQGLIDCDGRILRHAQHGEGVVDFKLLFNMLHENKYNGYFTVEYTPKNDNADHFEKMKQSILYFNELINKK